MKVSQRLIIAEKKAEELINELKLHAYITPLEKITEHLQIQVQFAPQLGREIESCFLVDKDKRILGVNIYHSNPYRRFAIAHNIGHYVLHHRTIDQPNLFVDNDFLVRNRNEEKGIKELEANAFGAALLIQRGLIEQYLSEIKGNLITYKKIKLLAKAFDVSDLIMTYRLTKLQML